MIDKVTLKFSHSNVRDGHASIRACVGDDEVIGTLNLQLLRQAGFKKLLGIKKPPHLRVEWIWIDPSYRGCGIALKMHGYLKKHFSDYRIDSHVATEKGVKFHKIDKKQKLVHNLGNRDAMDICFRDAEPPSQEYQIPKEKVHKCLKRCGEQSMISGLDGLF